MVFYAYIAGYKAMTNGNTPTLMYSAGDVQMTAAWDAHVDANPDAILTHFVCLGALNGYIASKPGLAGLFRLMGHDPHRWIDASIQVPQR